MVEYAVVLALIALAAIGLAAVLGLSVSDFFSSEALRGAMS